jgi:cell division protein FtsX
MDADTGKTALAGHEAFTDAARRLVLAGLSALTLALAACGGASTPARTGTVKVSFCTTVSMPECKSDASAAQEQAVGRMLRQIPNVEKIAFVSKAEALKRFKKMEPGIPVKYLPVNPLPDEWVVTVTSDQDEETVGKTICAARYPGVEACATSSMLGDVGGVRWGSPITDRIRRLRP